MRSVWRRPGTLRGPCRTRGPTTARCRNHLSPCLFFFLCCCQLTQPRCTCSRATRSSLAVAVAATSKAAAPKNCIIASKVVHSVGALIPHRRLTLLADVLYTFPDQSIVWPGHDYKVFSVFISIRIESYCARRTPHPSPYTCPLRATSPPPSATKKQPIPAATPPATCQVRPSAGD